MAKTVAKTKGRPQAAAAQKGGSKVSSNRLLIQLLGIAMVPFSLPTILVLFCGMPPTVGALLTERGKSRYAWICVGGLNFAGLSPWLVNLWFGHHDFVHAIEVITDVGMYLVAYGASAVGWLIYSVTPPIVGTIAGMTSQSRLATLAATRKSLVEKWGDGIIGRDELD